MPLLLNQLPPLHWAVAGAAIAALTLALLFFDSRRLGISSGFEDLCSVVLRGPFFMRKSVQSGRRWRLPFLVGLLFGGFLSAIPGGGWEPTWALGRLDQAAALGTGSKVAWMFAGGLFIGFGTRLAGGCTSGHGIFGLSNLELPSLVTAVSFMLGGILTTQLIYRVVFA
jgi:uncharacterized membrane protein YedE/YeeE